MSPKRYKDEKTDGDLTWPFAVKGKGKKNSYKLITLGPLCQRRRIIYQT